MGLGTVTFLGLLCTPGQVPAETTVWNTPAAMKIPIDYHPGKRGEIRELLLYVSADQGQTWQQHAVGIPDRDTHFTFNAPADGVYWFNMVVVDKAGRREPADVFKATPALKVLFDTKKPVVQIASAQRVGDDVTVVWKVTERNPDWSKFRVEWSANGAGWTPVPTRPEADGSTQFKVSGGGTLSVRVALTDAAGHIGEATSPVAGTAAVATAKPAAEAIVPVQGTADPVIAPPPMSGMGPAPLISPPPGTPTTDRARDTRLPGEPNGADTPAPPAIGVFPPAPGTPGAPTTDLVGPKDPVGVSTSALSHLPPPQVINVTSFKLAYEVEDKGASGVGKAEVYVTRDEGRTWMKWTSIDKPESPLVIDLARNNISQVEGIYGVKVVLQSGAGLGREAPKPGETPDLRVDVDVTAPTVHIFSPVPDRTQKDTMILQWTAVDRNLAADPITLEWADGPKGPWVPIAAADGLAAGGSPRRLPNSGSYGWKLPSNFPAHKVYLKVTARDTAGNIAEAITNQPVLVDLNKPAAVKLNIVGGGR
jgi:hypothetical protein